MEAMERRSSAEVVREQCQGRGPRAVVAPGRRPPGDGSGGEESSETEQSWDKPFRGVSGPSSGLRSWGRQHRGSAHLTSGRDREEAWGLRRPVPWLTQRAPTQPAAQARTCQSQPVCHVSPSGLLQRPRNRGQCSSAPSGAQAEDAAFLAGWRRTSTGGAGGRRQHVGAPDAARRGPAAPGLSESRRRSSPRRSRRWTVMGLTCSSSAVRR